MLRLSVVACGLAAVVSVAVGQIEPVYDGRAVMDLNGKWQAAIGQTEPESFDSLVPVPGPISQAKPKLADSFFHPSRHRAEDFEGPKYVWLKKTFDVLPFHRRRHASVRIGGAKFTATVWLNGVKLGQHVGGYTPFELPASGTIQTQGQNEILIRLGDWRTLPKGSPSRGANPECVSDPMVWDDVEIIFFEGPRAKNIRVIPDIGADSVIVEMQVENLDPEPVTVELVNQVVNAKGRRKVSQPATTEVKLSAGQTKDVKLRVAIDKPVLWTPDNPHLYVLRTKVKKPGKLADAVDTRFGYRSFGMDNQGRFLLNDKPILLTGANIAFHRSLNNPEIYSAEFIRRVLIEIPKAHNFVMFDVHQGPAPRRWLDAFDEGGLMVLATWPWWGRTAPGNDLVTPTGEHIAREFREWMWGAFNHPSVVIWEPVNTDAGGKHYVWSDGPEESKQLFAALKQLDPTRLWGSYDFLSTHPYKAIAQIDEFDDYMTKWVWQSAVTNWPEDRGTIPLLNDEFGVGYGLQAGPRMDYLKDTARRGVEFWRRYDAAGILPFCYYSGSNGAFIRKVDGKWQPKPYMESLKWAFAPLGMSIDIKQSHLLVGGKINPKVYHLNDTGRTIRDVSFEYGVYPAGHQAGPARYALHTMVEPYARTIVPHQYFAPDKPGDYIVFARSAIRSSGKVVGKSEYPIYVFKPLAAPEATDRGPIGIIGSAESPEAVFANQRGVKLVKIDPKTMDGLDKCKGLIVLPDAFESRLDEAFAANAEDIEALLKSGGDILVMNPKLARSLPLPGGRKLARHRNPGGPWGMSFAHWLTLGEPKHAFFKGLKEAHFQHFNGGLWGNICKGDTSRVEGQNVKTSILLKWQAQTQMAVHTLGDWPGRVIVSNVLMDARLTEDQTFGDWPLLKDPVARRLMNNILSDMLDG